MNMRHTGLNGFTLLELIVIIVLIGIVASFMAVYFGKKVINAPDMILVSQREARVEQVMEEIMGAYLVEINGANPDGALAAVVAQEAAFEDVDGDGSPDLEVEFDWISFTAGGAEQVPGGATPNLKVTVFTDPNNTNAEQHRLTTLLTQARTTAGNEPVVNF